ncbi:TIGR04540 family protein [Pseudalkalibacillus caeni]|uniref:TIGR04540 family protein n=1 Tax=Exobacillus caeni TaxID=2574798 RepID=A0A5R9F6J4_9BACL|nr:TIGR04540 family protein [Pseudalkalibacillus caeni]TLS35405.1 TIGR04540 family protein [Pseudalkalibacillus caeni]
MEVKLFHKRQRDLAASINEVIDKYWQDEIEESEMISLIQKLYTINKAKLVKDGRFTTIIRQQCGKKRLDVVSFILRLNEENEKSFLSV